MDPLELGKLILLLGGMAGLYLKINQAVRSATGKGEPREIANNPLNVREAPEFITRRECALHHHNFENRLTSLEHRFNNHLSEIRETTDGLKSDVADLRDRMDDKLSTMDETLREMSRSLGRLEGS